MAKLTVGRMAKLYGLHRSSLYEALSRGRVSCGFDGRGRRVIDLSEMVRVYGEPPAETRHLTPSQDAPSPTPDTSRLEGQLEELKRLVERQSQQLEALRQEVAGLKALPAPPDRPPDPPREEVRSLGDVLSRFEARRH